MKPLPSEEIVMDVSYLPGKFIWFEHISNDSEKAVAFYSELLGWQAQQMPLEQGSYTMIMNGEAGIGGFRNDATGPAYWMSYVSVTDVDASAQAAAQAGATVLQPPTDFPPVGRGATLQDPQGAVFSLWRSNQGDAPDTPSVPIGGWYWNELVTSDPPAACAFYKGLLGYQIEEQPMGDFTYYLLKTGEIPRAGLFQVPQPGAPVGWEPYLRVADCDASFKLAMELGASVCVEPKDIPGVGRFAILQDPTGAIVGIIHGNN